MVGVCHGQHLHPFCTLVSRYVILLSKMTNTLHQPQNPLSKFWQRIRKGDRRDENLNLGTGDLPGIWDEYCQRGYRYILNLKCFRETYVTIEKMLLPCIGGVVFDGGCGTGGMFRLILEKIQPSKVLAADFSEEMLKEAKENAARLSGERRGLFEFKKFDLTQKFPWSDSTFDAEVFNLALCYLPDRKWIGATKEIYRTLKPGGYVYISIMLEGWDFPQMIKERIRDEFLANPIKCLLAKRIQKSSVKINKCVESGVIQYPPEEEYLKLLEQIGFVNTKKERIFWGSGMMIRAQKPNGC